MDAEQQRVMQHHRETMKALEEARMNLVAAARMAVFSNLELVSANERLIAAVERYDAAADALVAPPSARRPTPLPFASNDEVGHG